MQIKRLELADAPVELIDHLAGNYFFSTISFARVWETIGGKAVYWAAQERGVVVAVLPGVEFGWGMFRRFQSMPDGCYSSILLNDSVSHSQEEIGALIASSILKMGYTKIFINDFHKSFPNLHGFESVQSQTYLVNISSREWEPLDSKLRQQIHKAERSGLQLEKFNSARHLDSFMNLVGLHEKRRNLKLRYGRSFFEALAVAAQDDDRIKWIWCEHDDKPVSSHIFIVEGESLLHWQMYYDETKSELKATKYIPYKVAKEAAEKGVRTLNLGSTPPEAEGAEFYKNKWGGEEYTYNSYVHKSFLGRIL